MKVDFIIAGAMKCGTSSLSDLLRGHPGISFSNPKEPDFFSKVDDWETRLEEYHSRFDRSKDPVLFGEGSTSYCKYPHLRLEIWQDIFEYNPKMKIIYMVRHPLKRIVSHYMHNYQRAYTRANLEECVVKYAEYVDFSRYFMQIEPYIRTFGRDRVLILEFEGFIEDQRKALQKVAAFLNVDDGAFPSSPIHRNPSVDDLKFSHRLDPVKNKIRPLYKSLPSSIQASLKPLLLKLNRRSFKEKPPVPAKIERALVTLLEDDVRKMEKLLDKNLSHWLELK